MRRVLLLGSLSFACATSPAPTSPPPETIPSPPPAPNGPALAPAPTVTAGADAGASPDAGPAIDPKAELAWAKSRWPKELANVQIEPHTAALLKWVALGKELEIWFTTEKLRCKRGVAQRAEKDETLELKVFTAEKRVNGQKVRAFTDGSAGHYLYFGGGGGDERQAADGSWEPHGGWGVSENIPIGVLSKVEGDVARYDGTAVIIAASCDGPMQQIKCPDGRTRDCDTCQKVTVDVSERPMGMLGRASVGVKLGPCSCPETQNPDFDRAARLFAELDAWAPKKPRAAIYRTAAACKADKIKP